MTEGDRTGEGAPTERAARPVREILIAEDDGVSRRLLKATLERWEYRVVAVEDGTKAWEALSSPNAPRLAILDWMMPGMDGLEVCRNVRAVEGGSYTYIILLTAKGGRQDVASGFEAGVDDYLVKPFESQELRGRILVGERVIDLETKLAARVSELQDALHHVKQLQGLIPMCMHCKKIRTDSNVWQRLEVYLHDHTDALVSHCLCEDCLAKHYPEQARRMKERG